MIHAGAAAKNEKQKTWKVKSEVSDDAAGQGAKDRRSWDKPEEVRQGGAAADAAAGTVDATPARGLMLPQCRNCDYAVTWYDEPYCCKKCEESPCKHGKKCDRQLHSNGP